MTIESGESFLTHSIKLDSNDFLLIDGTLRVSTDFTAGGELDFSDGTLNVGSLEINGYDIQGTGQVNANSVVNNSRISGVSLQTQSFKNNGAIIAGGNTTINVAPGGFANLSASTLTGGSYEADAYDGTAYALSLNVGGVIVTDAASITLGGGVVQSFDNASGQYVPLTTSLQTIASNGSLDVTGTQSYAFGHLTVAGTLSLGTASTDPYSGSAGTTGSFGSSQLVVVAGGLVSGAGTVDGPISNQGVIQSGYGVQQNNDGSSTLVLQGPVTGTGALEISPGFNNNARYVLAYSADLELGGPASGAVKFDNNIGTLTLDAPSAFTGTIAPSSVGAGDVINLANTSLDSITGETYSGTTAGGTLTLQEGSSSLSLNFVGDYNVDSFTLSKGPQQLSSDPPSVDITIAAPVCFAAGTRIRVARAGAVLDVAVEQLETSDLAVTSNGLLRPIRWLGHRTIDCRSHPRREAVLPIRVAANAFGPHRPTHDLLVSPGHAICVEAQGEVLIPASALANGTTIRQIEAEHVTYWHVELDSHDVILAEGLPAESYLEMGNRAFFSEAALVALAAGPDVPAPAHTHVDFCRPFHDAGPVVDAVRARLAGRADRIDRISSENCAA